MIKHEKIYTEAQAQTILSKVKNRYVDAEKLKKYMLMWNSFRLKPRCLPFEKIQQLGIPVNRQVFFYDERQNILFSTTLQHQYRFTVYVLDGILFLYAGNPLNIIKSNIRVGQG